ncbi:hypothetical protein [Ectobacillus panaciterrae]|uniref:hypothetical protein n=1 Tax=Ectobacillus panaciterrae TaxID=363872 RepID=UPI00041A24BF|nr:hypothetical protein [Ectobacillus panaciterrae]
MKKIRCQKCAKTIKRPQDLITVFFYFRIFFYHETCYEEELQYARFPFTNLIPLNTLLSNIFTVFTFLAALTFLFTDTGGTRLLGLLLLLPALYRLISYLKWERTFRK